MLLLHLIASTQAFLVVEVHVVSPFGDQEAMLSLIPSLPEQASSAGDLRCRKSTITCAASLLLFIRRRCQPCAGYQCDEDKAGTISDYYKPEPAFFVCLFP